MSETSASSTPAAPPPAALRFPLATARQVRREVARQLGTVPRARWWFLLAVALLGAGSYATVLVPQLMGQIVDLVSGNGAAKPMGRIGSELLLLSIAGAAMSAAGFYLVARLSERVIANLRQDMVGTALGLPTHQVEDAGTGDLVSRSTDDVAELSAAVTETLPTLSTSLFSIVATVIALLALDWYFLLIPVVVAPVYYVAARMYLARAPQRYAAERAAMAERAAGCWKPSAVGRQCGRSRWRTGCTPRSRAPPGVWSARGSRPAPRCSCSTPGCSASSS